MRAQFSGETDGERRCTAEQATVHRRDSHSLLHLEARFDVLPVDHFEEAVEVGRALALVLQVVGVLPHVDYEQRFGHPLREILVPLSGQDLELSRRPVLHEQAPA